jgi:DNA-binding winged helix-turn-helix (wHTH) protein
MEPTDRVDLAHAPGFTLGRLSVRPAVHQLVRDDGAEEVLQHRVMQVLVALARADGAIVTRDELTMSCWDGRVVGEDAINRILSRLRGVAAGIGAGSFRIETITRVGYRLLREGQAAADIAEVPAAAPAPSGRTRRRFLAGAGAAGIAALAGGAWWWRGSGAAEPSAPEADLAVMDQALAAYRQGTPEGNNQAIGLLRQLVERHPDSADAWGLLSVAYWSAYWGLGYRYDAGMAARAEAAHRRAEALDPHNLYAELAGLSGLPLVGSWARVQARLRAIAAEHRDSDMPSIGLAWSLSLVGRWRDAIVPAMRALALAPTSSGKHSLAAYALWGAGRIEEADRIVDRGLELFSAQPTVWFARYYLDLYTGRTAEALAFANERSGRPPGIPDAEFHALAAVAGAAATRAPAEVDAVMRTAAERARRGTGYAELLIQFACLFGRIDAAFAGADALYFGRGFNPGEQRFATEQARFNRRDDRHTQFLFLPHTAPMRADPRFDRLVTEIGLTRYWQETGSRPDYRSA